MTLSSPTLMTMTRDRSSTSAGGSHGALWITVLLVLAPVLYLASWPPVLAYLNAQRDGPPDRVMTFYTPAMWVCRETPLGSPMQSYYRQCEKLFSTKGKIPFPHHPPYPIKRP